MQDTIEKLTLGYQAVHERQQREYFGLRDFYSVVKMAFEVAKSIQGKPDETHLKHVIQRNFGGYFGSFDPCEVFLEKAGIPLREGDKISSKDLIINALNSGQVDTRYD